MWFYEWLIPLGRPMVDKASNEYEVVIEAVWVLQATFSREDMVISGAEKMLLYG
jgi:hypothetical protein